LLANGIEIAEAPLFLRINGMLENAMRKYLPHFPPDAKFPIVFLPNSMRHGPLMRESMLYLEHLRHCRSSWSAVIFVVTGYLLSLDFCMHWALK
jgi:hypothetical protein